MLLRLFIVFTVLPFLELTLLLWIGRVTSWWTPLSIVIGTGFAGAWLARREGLRCWRRIQDETTRGELPAESLFDGVMVLLASVLLITPGVITDAAAILLLVPGVRQSVRSCIARRVASKLIVRAVPRTGPYRPEDDIIDIR